VLTSRLQVPDDVLAQHIASMGSVIVFLLFLVAGLAILLIRERAGLPTASLGVLAGVVVALDLLSLGAYVEVEPNDPLVGYQHERVVAFLRSDPDVFRVEVAAEIRGRWAPDWALIHEMDDLHGIWNPLRLGAYDVLTWVGIQREDPFYDLYNVKYLVANRETTVPAHFELSFAEGEQLVYQNTRYLPRAFIVYDVVTARGDIGALSKARAKEFDPRTQMVLKQDGATVASPGDTIPEGAEAAIVDRGPNRLSIRVSTVADGYLFVSEMWMPGWKAYVDGAAGPVLQANYTFRAVPIPAGNHQVEMVYRPFSWLLGLGVTLTTLTALAVWGSSSLWRQRRKRRHGT
jgi:hypothetical protein